MFRSVRPEWAAASRDPTSRPRSPKRAASARSGLAPHTELRESITRVRECAPGRAVAVNLLTPFLRRSHVSVCVRARVEAAVVAFGGDRELVEELRAAGIFVLVMVGTPDQARRAIGWGADGLIAQGGEAGGHLSGTTEALQFLPRALAIADGRPVLLAGGIATAADTQSGVGRRSQRRHRGDTLLVDPRVSEHIPTYQRRVLAADRTFQTMLFGLGWPAPHRVIPNAATERWCNGDGTAKPVTRVITRGSAFLAKLPPTTSALKLQSPRLPWFSPIAPTIGMPASAVDRAACYAGQSALRMKSVTSARQALMDLSPGGQ